MSTLTNEVRTLLVKTRDYLVKDGHYEGFGATDLKHSMCPICLISRALELLGAEPEKTPHHAAGRT
ncbi:hypothetical protein ES703_94198 [subsurface metagenome]